MINRLVTSVTLVLLFCLANSAAAATKDESTLSFGDVLGWKIVVPAEAIESEKYAAEELNAVIEKINGSPLEITDKIPADGGYILIGQSAGLNTADLGEEGLQIDINPNYIIITGGRPRGVLYGVYEFCEKYLDVQFLTTDHTFIPESVKDVKLPCGSYTYIPEFVFRWAYLAENNGDQKFATRMRTNTTQTEKKCGGNCGYSLINHSFHHHLPIAKYGKEHPEYFMMQNGHRAIDFADTWGLGPNPCYASEGALKVITESAMDYFKNDPDKKNISLSCVDSHAYCECPECSKMNDQHGGTSGSHFDFINRVARIIGEKYPDKFVGSLAYYHTRHAPTNMKMEDNVQIQLCSIECCTFHALDDPNCPKNVAFYKDIKDWAKICKNIMIWNYNVDFHRYDMPFPNLKSIGPNVRFFRDNNVTGVFMQSAGNSHNSSMSDLKNWVISQCLWKPGSDSWDLALKFCKMHYVESAGPIIEWLSLLHNHVGLSDVHYNCFPEAEDMNLDTDMAKKAIAFFQQAMDLAKSDEIRSRVEKASIGGYRLMLEASPYERVGDAYKLILPEGYENTLETYKALVEKYKTNMATERATFKEYYKRIEDRKIVTLENDIWKIELLPSWNAKLIYLLYKPKNLQLLKPRFEKRRVREVWDEQAIIGINSELVRDYVITYKVNSQDSGSVSFSAVLDDGSKLSRKIWFDPQDPAKICCKTEFTYVGDQPKEYQFRVIPHFRYEGVDEEALVRDFVTKVQHNGKMVELKELTGGAVSGRKYTPVDVDSPGCYTVFNKKDNFGLKMDFTNLVVEHPPKWWEYYGPRLLTKQTTLKKDQTMTWEYDLSPIKKETKD